MLYPHASLAVTVMVNQVDHHHEEAEGYVTAENYHWNENQVH